MNINPSYPAFPAIATVDKQDVVQPLQTSPSGFSFPGLTIRAHFAAMAMSGMMANQVTIQTIARSDDHHKAIQELSEMAVISADALIAALNK